MSARDPDLCVVDDLRELAERVDTPRPTAALCLEAAAAIEAHVADRRRRRRRDLARVVEQVFGARIYTIGSET